MAKAKVKAPAEEKKAEPKTDIVVASSNGPGSIATLSEQELAELQGVEGAGYSDNVEDRGVPLLYIAQKGSPQLDKKQDKYIEGCEFGDIFNNLSREVWAGESDGLELLPCFFRANWNEWTPRDDGGGFHGSHPRDTGLVSTGKPFVHPESGKVRRDIIVLPNGNHLVLTHHYYCIIKKTWDPIIVPMSSTQLGPSRTLQALIGAQKAQVGNRIVVKPSFWKVFNFKTIYKDDGDNQWYLWNPLIIDDNNDPQLKAFCKEFALACVKNEVKMSAPEGAEVTTGEVDDNPPV